jgi:hypothetical protein
LAKQFQRRFKKRVNIDSSISFPPSFYMRTIVYSSSEIFLYVLPAVGAIVGRSIFIVVVGGNVVVVVVGCLIVERLPYDTKGIA